MILIRRPIWHVTLNTAPEVGINHALLRTADSVAQCRVVYPFVTSEAHEGPRLDMCSPPSPTFTTTLRHIILC